MYLYHLTLNQDYRETVVKFHVDKEHNVDSYRQHPEITLNINGQLINVKGHTIYSRNIMHCECWMEKHSLLCKENKICGHTVISLDEYKSEDKLDILKILDLIRNRSG